MIDKTDQLREDSDRRVVDVRDQITLISYP